MSKEQTPITAEEKILKAFELTFSVKPKNIFDIMNLSVEEFVDVLDNFLHNEQKETQAKVLEVLEREWIDVKQQPKESGEYLVSMVGGVDIAMYYKDTNEWKSVDRPLKNAYGKQVIRETLSPTAWMKLPKQK